MDTQLRANKYGPPRTVDLMRAGLLSKHTIQRMAVCGDKDAQAACGFTRKPKVTIIPIIKVLLREGLEDRIALVNAKIRGCESWAPKPMPLYKWMLGRKHETPWFLMLTPWSNNRHVRIARSLTQPQYPGWWWLQKNYRS